MKNDLLLIALTFVSIGICAVTVILFQQWFDKHQKELLAKRQHKCLLKVAVEREMKNGNAVKLIRRCENSNVDYLPLLSFGSRKNVQRQLLHGKVDLILLSDSPDREMEFSYIDISYFGEEFCAVWSGKKISSQRERLVHSLTLGNFSLNTSYTE